MLYLTETLKCSTKAAKIRGLLVFPQRPSRLSALLAKIVVTAESIT